MGISAGLGSLVGGIGGSLVSTVGGLLGNRASQKSANKQMDVQQMMSSTAHQREVEDLRKAGLNPILSATGGSGASTPSGAMGQMKNPFEGAGEGLQSTAARLQKDPLIRAEVAKAEAEKDLTVQKKAESEALESSYKWDSFLKDTLEKVQRNEIAVKHWQARNLEKDYYKHETVGKAFELGGKAIDKYKDMGKELYNMDWGHVLKGAGMYGEEYFNKAKDFIKNLGSQKSFRGPSDTFGAGKGNVPGGDHRAAPGQKVPWSEVEKQKGSEDSPNHPSNWKRR